MIYELDKNDYEKVRPVFQELAGWNLSIDAVIEGTSPGRVYVDDVSQPRIALLGSVEGYFLAGCPDNAAFNRALNQLIATTVFAGDLVREGDGEFDLRVMPDKWEEKLPVILDGLNRQPIKIHRRYYACRALKVNWRDQVPDGFAVRRIDNRLLEQPGLTIPDHVPDWMKTNWGSIDDFMQGGFGFCTIHADQLVSWSLTDHVSGSRCEVGIRTHPDYRRRGLATLTAAAAVDYAFSQGLAVVGWHCNDNNTGSWKVAENVGFVRTVDYFNYTCMLDEAQHLAVTGLYQFLAKAYREAADSYEKAFGLQAVLPTYDYHLAARVWAALGEREKAFQYLNQAIDRGENRLELTTTCPEFEALHGAPQWQEVLARLQANKELPHDKQ